MQISDQSLTFDLKEISQHSHQFCIIQSKIDVTLTFDLKNMSSDQSSIIERVGILLPSKVTYLTFDLKLGVRYWSSPKMSISYIYTEKQCHIQ